MKQFTEDYCSFEIAKLLKEKGFNEYCPLWYNLDKPTDGPLFYKEIGWYGHNSYDYIGKRIVSAPTHQMALKWLREVHKIFVEPFVSIDLNGKYHYCFRLLNSICKDILEPKDLVKIDFKDTYEEAVEAALKYTLENLI